MVTLFATHQTCYNLFVLIQSKIKLTSTWNYNGYAWRFHIIFPLKKKEKKRNANTNYRSFSLLFQQNIQLLFGSSNYNEANTWIACNLFRCFLARVCVDFSEVCFLFITCCFVLKMFELYFYGTKFEHCNCVWRKFVHDKCKKWQSSLSLLSMKIKRLRARKSFQCHEQCQSTFLLANEPIGTSLIPMKRFGCALTHYCHFKFSGLTFRNWLTINRVM